MAYTKIAMSIAIKVIVLSFPGAYSTH